MLRRLGLIISALLSLGATARADEIRTAGATSQCFAVFVGDSTSSAGAGLTGLAYNSAGLTCYYFRNETATGETATSITLATSTLGTFTSGAFKEISSTNMPGWYEFCPPDGSLASGAASVSYQCKGATNMAPMNLRTLLFGTADVNIISIAANAITAASIAAAAITSSEAPNLDVAVSSVSGGGGAGALVADGKTTIYSANVSGVVTGSTTTSVKPHPKFVAGKAYLITDYVSGTATTLDVTLQHSPDGTNWFDVGSFTQATTSDTSDDFQITSALYSNVRAKITTTGTSPNYNVTVEIWGEQR